MWTAWLYALISWLTVPLWPLMIWLRLRRNKEDPQRWLERWGIYRRVLPYGSIWLHAASVGEWRSLQPLLQTFWQQDEAQQFVITTQTRTAAQLIAQTGDSRLHHLFAPWDHPLTVRAFLKWVQPRAAIFVESEIWPQLLTALKQHNIPAILLNAQLSEKAVKRWQPLRGWLQSLLSTFQTIITPNAAETQRFRQLNIDQTQTGISLKYASAPLGCDIEALFEWRDLLQARPIWLAASTHAGEEEIILAAHQQLQKQFPNLLTVIAPRHPERCINLFNAWQAQYRVQKRSDQQQLQDDTEILLVDQLGELGLWFRLCPITFLGGSLVPIGGHNLIEPAQLSCAILHGPYMQSCQDVADLLQAASATQTVQTADELAQAIANLLTDPNCLQLRGRAAQQVVFGQRNAAQQMIEKAIAALLPEAA